VRTNFHCISQHIVINCFNTVLGSVDYLRNFVEKQFFVVKQRDFACSSALERPQNTNWDGTPTRTPLPEADRELTL
jgi:hypothetical protein